MRVFILLCLLACACTKQRVGAQVTVFNPTTGNGAFFANGNGPNGVVLAAPFTTTTVAGTPVVVGAGATQCQIFNCGLGSETCCDNFTPGCVWAGGTCWAASFVTTAVVSTPVVTTPVVVTNPTVVTTPVTSVPVVSSTPITVTLNYNAQDGSAVTTTYFECTTGITDGNICSPPGTTTQLWFNGVCYCSPPNLGGGLGGAGSTFSGTFTGNFVGAIDPEFQQQQEPQMQVVDDEF